MMRPEGRGGGQCQKRKRGDPKRSPRVAATSRAEDGRQAVPLGLAERKDSGYNG